MAESSKRRLLGGVQLLLAVFGIASLGYCAFSYLDAWWLDQRVEIRRLNVVGRLEAPSLEAPTAEAPAPLEPGAVVGRIRIPRLDVDAVVLEGTEGTVLRRAVGRISSTRQPWESGTVGLAAHRDSFFRSLGEIEEGDLMQLATDRGTWTYRVTGHEVVELDAVHVLSDTEKSRLVLVTCYPFNYVGSAPQRFVVYADRVEPDASPRKMLVEMVGKAREASKS
ncbi:MAG TPA: class D sortase [Thermoanaerobaculia bacterium]|jgi:sortase A